MKKLNQKSINKIIFLKLFENTNDTFQDVRIDSSKMNVSSMSGMNEPPQRVVPTKLQVRQDPKKPGKPVDLDPRKTPEDEWDEWMRSHGWEDDWRLWWEEHFGAPKNLDFMHSEFLRMMEQLRQEYLWLRRDTPRNNGGNGRIDKNKAFQQLMDKFRRYFTDPAPTMA